MMSTCEVKMSIIIVPIILGKKCVCVRARTLLYKVSLCFCLLLGIHIVFMHNMLC